MSEPAETPPRGSFARWRSLIAWVRLQPGRLVFATLLTLASAVFEGVGTALLIPLLEGALQRDFGFLQENPDAAAVLELLPAELTSSNAGLFGTLLATCFLAIVLKLVLAYASAVIFEGALYRMSHELRSKLMDRYLRFGMSFFDESNTGYLRSLLLGHTSTLILALGAVRWILLWWFTLLVYGTLMVVVSWELSVAAFLVIPLLLLSLETIHRRLKAGSVDFARGQRKLNEFSFNLLVGMPLVRASNMQARELERFDGLSGELQDVSLAQARRQWLLPPLQEGITTLVVLLLVVATGYLLSGASATSLAGYLVFFYLLRRCSGVINQINTARSSLTRLSGLLDQMLEVLDDGDKPYVPSGETTFAGLQEEIRFDGLSFAYASGVPVLTDVSFSIPRGTTTAIVGHTGSGKTTLVKLLLRFYDVPPGTITIDGQDLRSFQTDSLRRHMGFVSQDTLLMNDTLRSNVCYGLDVQPDEAALQETLERARLTSLIERTPQGLEGVVGERGVKLSGGERQRLSIARALLRGAEILILDEATSSLDTQTEQLVQQAIDESLRDRTAIVIAHRLSTIQNADQVVLLENGRVVEQGSLEELLAAEGSFHAYWQAQHSGPGANGDPK